MMRRRSTQSSFSSMKKGKTPELGMADVDADDILPEYDFSQARPNKYAALYRDQQRRSAKDLRARSR